MSKRSKLKLGAVIGSLVIAVLLGFSSFPTEVLARSGCCSWHGGVCSYQCPYGGGTGYGCCDGTPLSSTCAPYYSSCPAAPLIVTRIKVKTVSIAFKTERRENPNILKGETKVVQQGVNGSKEITYKVTYTDGVETSRKKVSEVVVKQPVNKIVAIGTKKEVVQVPEPEESEPNGEVAGVATKSLSFSDLIAVLLIFGAPALLIKKFVLKKK